MVDVAPMALYNAFRYNYADVQGCSLLIDIGARTTNLIFVEPNKVFSRSIPIGGTTFTANIAKEFSEPFGAAEERKRSDGFVSLGGSYAEPSDPEIARVSKIIRNSMTRLHAEITRSISFYRAQQGGSPAAAGVPVRRQRGPALHPRVLQRETPDADRVFEPAAERDARPGRGSGSGRLARRIPWASWWGWPSAPPASAPWS